MIVGYVEGVPAPQGSKRHIGNGRMIESSKKVGPWRKAVAEEFAHISEPMEGPIIIMVAFLLDKKASVVRLWPTVPPDLDKLERGLLDALTLAGVWKDDAQVVSIISSKMYRGALPEGALIGIFPAADGPWVDLENRLL